METPGMMLRRVREERGMSLSEARQLVKIRESALHAMETDQYEKFPASYMQVFLPEYADFLGVSPHVLAESFQKTLPEYGYLTRTLAARKMLQLEQEYFSQNMMETVMPAIRQYSRLVAITAVGFFLLWYVFVSDMSLVNSLFAARIVPTPQDMRGETFTELDKTAPEEQQPFNISQQEAQKRALAQERVQATPQADEQLNTQSNTIVAPENAEVLTPLAQSGNNTALAQNSTMQRENTVNEIDKNVINEGDKPQKLILSVNPKQRLWVRVVIDQNTIEDVVLDAGKSYTWSARKGFRVSLGHGRVKVALNGRVLGNLCAPGAPARDVEVSVARLSALAYTKTLGVK